MAQIQSVRSIRNRLFLLLLRAFGIAVTLLVVFVLIATVFFLSRPLRANPLFQLPITSSLETFYVARGSWNGVSGVFDRSAGIEAAQWRHALLLDPQNRVIVQHGRPIQPASTWTYQPDPTDVSIPIRANGAVAGTLIIEGNSRPSEVAFVLRYLLPIITITILLAIFATLIGLLLSRGVVAPLAEVIASAEQISAGNLGARVQKTRGSDVLGDLSESFNKMATSLDQNDRERREMLTNIAHELRTPLTILRGRLEGIMDGIYPSDPGHIGPALEETYLLERLVEDLRLLTLAESHQLTFEQREIDLVEIARRSLSMFQPVAEEHKVTLELKTDLEQALVTADPLRTEQVIGNLLANALRYVPEQGRVWIEIGRQGDELTISVNDNGAGVPESDLPFIFQRFWRGEKSRSRTSGGAGLGLAIAKLLVEEQAGRIDAHNLPQGGLQVKMYFKCEAAPAA